MRRDVRILLVGDGLFLLSISFSLSLQSNLYVACCIPSEGVGKSTIVTSLIKEEFVSHVRALSHTGRSLPLINSRNLSHSGRCSMLFPK